MAAGRTCLSCILKNRGSVGLLGYKDPELAGEHALNGPGTARHVLARLLDGSCRASLRLSS